MTFKLNPQDKQQLTTQKTSRTVLERESTRIEALRWGPGWLLDPGEGSVWMTKHESLSEFVWKTELEDAYLMQRFLRLCTFFIIHILP